MRPHIEATLKVTIITPAVNQIEFHPYLQRADDYVTWLMSRSSLWFQAAGSHPGRSRGPSNAVVDRIVRTHGVLVESVLIRWHVQKSVVPITTTAKQGRLDKYLEATQLELSDGEMEEITTVGLSRHYRN